MVRCPAASEMMKLLRGGAARRRGRPGQRWHWHHHDGIFLVAAVYCVLAVLCAFPAGARAAMYLQDLVDDAGSCGASGVAIDFRNRVPGLGAAEVATSAVVAFRFADASSSAVGVHDGGQDMLEGVYVCGRASS